MAAEDFAYMLEARPGAFINIGNAGSLEAAMSFTAALLFAWISCSVGMVVGALWAI